MKTLSIFAHLGALILLLAPVFADEEPLRRYLYMSTPDGAQGEGNSGSGILIFDIDQGHAFVRRVDIPDFEEGLRGFTGTTKTGSVYFSTTNRRLGCYDLEKGEIVWNRQYPAGCDRSCVTPDGKRIYAPTGWWYGGDDSGFLVIDAISGELIDRITVNAKAHNSIATLDGKHVFLGTLTTLTMFDAADGRVVRTIAPVGESGVFPYTIDSRTEKAFVCLGGHVGFDVVDLKEGKVLHRVFATDANGEKIKHRTHGAGMTPDETELWISDQKGNRLFIFDITKMPPQPAGHVELSMGGHGWVCFSLDGKFAYCHTPDVFDVNTRELVATLKDQDGNRFASSKFIEVHFRGDKVIRIGNEFGLGRVNEAP